MYDFNWPAAEREFARAIELDPNNADAHEYHAWLLLAVGHGKEALDEARRAERLDPVFPEYSAATAWWLYYLRQYDDAVTRCGECLNLSAQYPFCLWILGRAHAQQQRFQEAIEAEAKVLKGDPAWLFAQAESGRIYALWGRRTEAQHTLDDMIARSKRAHVSKYELATVYAALGDKDRALDNLEQAYAERSFFLDWIRLDPEVDSLRSEPRFQNIVRQMNFPQ
jgi:tetratricopeptide (TPR) repeat protein